ncbi:MAG TPA: DUF309 domain-containing protein [Trebonia sp.]|nr:DUF309 domain-containing protein [Trebonia sp.]
MTDPAGDGPAPVTDPASDGPGPVTDAASRDRDPGGRARNARPRDELGRPLPRSAASDVPRVPDDLVIGPDEAAELGGRLLDDGRPFHAHEVFEAAWKSEPGPGRELWRGLAQIAVGLTHARRGNAPGAVSLLRRGAAQVGAFADQPGKPGEPGPVDAGFVAGQASALAQLIERDGLAAVPGDALRLQLRP